MARPDGAVLAGCFPVASICGPVGALAVWVLAVSRAEEEPLGIICLYH